MVASLSKVGLGSIVMAKKSLKGLFTLRLQRHIKEADHLWMPKCKWVEGYRLKYDA